MEREMHIDTINCVKRYIAEKDYESLKAYIEMREKEIKEFADDNKASDYIDNLISNLQ